MSVDIAASVKARLLAQSQARGEEFERILARFVVERFLFRLGASPARARCLLKGASLLTLWMPDPYRATRDVDLLASGAVDDEAIKALVAEVCAVDYPEDGLRFDLSALSIEAIRPEEEYSGQRARFRAFLGSARIALQLDIGVGDAVVPGPEEVEYPTLLPSLAPPRLRAYPREAVVAEKFEAMVKLDIRNSRMKDFHDLWALSGAFGFKGSALQSSIAACFARRRTPWTAELPRVLTPAFYTMPELAGRWRHYLSSGAVLIPPPERFEEVGERIIAFLAPLREAILGGSVYDRDWIPQGRWEVEHEG
jgi:hypothetical protein